MQLTAPRGAHSRFGWATRFLARVLVGCSGARKSKVGTGVNTTAIGAWSNWELRSLLNGSGCVGTSGAVLDSRQQGMAAQQSRQLIAGAASVCAGDGPATVQASAADCALATCAKTTLQSSPTTSTSFATIGNVRRVVIMDHHNSIVVKPVTPNLLHESAHWHTVPSKKPVFPRQDFAREIRSLPLARPCKATGQEEYDPRLPRVEIVLAAARWPRTGRCGVSPMEWGAGDAAALRAGKDFSPCGLEPVVTIPATLLRAGHAHEIFALHS